jgi:hypothetical protein
METQYTHALEAEIARLRAENRAMLNSILGIAGVPPIPAQESELASDREAAGASRDASVQGPSSQRAIARGSVGNASTHSAVPLRRRSWHQINRMLEFQATHQESPTQSNGSNETSKPGL